MSDLEEDSLSLEDLDGDVNETADPSDESWSDSYDDLDAEAWDTLYGDEEEELDKDPWDLN